MKKFTDLRITDIKWNARSIQISWYSASAEMEAESCLYQHSDGTWAIDPVSRSFGSSFGEKLLTELMKTFISQTFPYDDASSFGSSDVAKVEGLIRKEQMFLDAVNKKAVTSNPKHRSTARVWFADGVVPPGF